MAMAGQGIGDYKTLSFWKNCNLTRIVAGEKKYQKVGSVCDKKDKQGN